MKLKTILDKIHYTLLLYDIHSDTVTQFNTESESVSAIFPQYTLVTNEQTNEQKTNRTNMVINRNQQAAFAI